MSTNRGELGLGRTKVSGFCLELRKTMIFPKNTIKNPENATRMALGPRGKSHIYLLIRLSDMY